MDSDALQWADMRENEFFVQTPRTQDMGIQTCTPVLALDERWTAPWLGVLCDSSRPELPDCLNNEILNYISWMLELILQPCTEQFYARMQLWQFSLRGRLWVYRLHYVQALAVYGVCF